MDAHILGLMYDELDGDIEMYILLPKSQVPSQDVLDRLIRDMSIYRLNDLTKDLHGQEVSIQIPKMALKGSYALSEVILKFPSFYFLHYFFHSNPTNLPLIPQNLIDVGFPKHAN